MNPTKVKTMDDLPELPFEQVMSYLSLEDVIKSRAVSRNWRKVIDNFKVKSLCCSYCPSGFIEEKSRWVSNVFAQNFIGSLRFESFFNTFAQSILSHLKHLRLCDLRLNSENMPAFIQSLNSFGRLEELDLIRFSYPPADSNPKIKYQLNFPMLKSIHIEINDEPYVEEKLTLDSPRLQKVKLFWGPLSLNLVHGESVERLIIEDLSDVEVRELKNLKYLYTRHLRATDESFLSGLDQLKEIHLDDRHDVSRVFEQKQQYGRTDLKIYFRGLLLNGQEDPAIDSLDKIDDEILLCLAENPTRLAEIPLSQKLDYPDFEPLAPEPEINVFKRFTDLKCIYVREVQNVQRFLDLLKSLDNIIDLCFVLNTHQYLFDRLPEHCAVQRLSFHVAPSDLRFLFRMKDLIEIQLSDRSKPCDAEFVRKAWKELPFLSIFGFYYANNFYIKEAEIRIDHSRGFKVWVEESEETDVPDLNAAIQFIIEKTVDDF